MNTTTSPAPRRFAFVSVELGTHDAALQSLLEAIHTSGRIIVVATPEEEAFLQSIGIEADEMSSDGELLVFNQVLTMLQAEDYRGDHFDLVIVSIPTVDTTKKTPNMEGPLIKNTHLSRAMVAMAAANDPDRVFASSDPREWETIARHLTQGGRIPQACHYTEARKVFLRVIGILSREVTHIEGKV